ncbi:MAG: single-stranded DNA-binding protein [Bryobacterales bacterium]|nr:single-stranded DNA-binding protein [Bryobacteraceae bacterium]MDW8130649.1 single-stranded DNA-binding protein [Bryobacterales bacterium]
MASRSVNKVILIGHLGKDAETRFTAGGAARTTFPLATNYRYKDPQTGEWKEETEWHNIVLWRQENLANYLTRGQQVYVEGRIQTRAYEDRETGQKRYMTEIVAQNVLLLGTRATEAPAIEESAAQVPARGVQKATTPPEEPFSEEITDDDVPF